ncbi:MAG: shikimate dehydrogenase [Candidatus Omnitrophota bacterium]|jgi:shikimate dehydrogenase
MSKSPTIYGLIGFPVKHSLSPAMYNAAFKYLNINAEYKLFELRSEEVGKFIASLEEQNISGLNVTIPYKEKVLDFVEIDSKSFYLRQIKAVNTIVVKEGIRRGFNTDIPGFGRDLVEKSGNPENKKAAILGAGGASRAVAYVLANDKVKDIAIYDIDKSKSQNIVDLIKSLFPDFPISAVDKIEELKIHDKELLINATPIGMRDTDPCLIAEEMLHKNLFVYDLIYNPAETKLLALAKRIGAKTSNGLGMLLYQGALSFEHFTGQSAPVDIMRKALMEGLKNAGNHK